MDDKPLLVITQKSLARWLFLGLPGTVMWVIGGLGALSLLGGLSNGSVVPGSGSTANSLGLMWGLILACAVIGIAVGMGSLFRPVSKRMLFGFLLFGVLSLFCTVLT